MKPIHNTDTLEKIEKNGYSKFNGDYEILSVDTNSIILDYTFVYKSLFNWKKLPGKSDHINLSAIDDRHIKATLFVNNKIVRSKTLKGDMNNNYFEFHSRHFSLKYVFISYGQQTNRLALSTAGDLYLDTNRGGISFLLIVPIPLSGSSYDAYNLKFKRKRNQDDK